MNQPKQIWVWKHDELYNAIYVIDHILLIMLYHMWFPCFLGIIYHMGFLLTITKGRCMNNGSLPNSTVSMPQLRFLFYWAMIFGWFVITLEIIFFSLFLLVKKERIQIFFFYEVCYKFLGDLLKHTHL